MPEKFEYLKKRLFGKEKEFDVIDRWHTLMLHYGYIPYEEFLGMDAHLVDELIERINKLYEKQQSPAKRFGRGGKF